MICPHCEYKYGYEWVTTKDSKGRAQDDYVKVGGECGEFWRLGTNFSRTDSIGVIEYADFYACPYCKKTFIEE